MFKRIISLLIVFLMISCSISSIFAADDNSTKQLTIHARTQENDGDGLIYFIDPYGYEFKIIPINKGETVILNLSDYPNLFRLGFKSKDRNPMYNANLCFIQNYVYSPCWNKNISLSPDLPDWLQSMFSHPEYWNYHIDVNFYKKSMYKNKFFCEKGWYDKDGTYCHHDSIQDAAFSGKNAVIIKGFFKEQPDI
ncbi:MAG: hypothetical protein LBD03_01780 [Methanobrevibacter sp.]|jgi:hypothetical protein|nr:hypothetical protein [Candidatus Methanovirga procula]